MVLELLINPKGAETKPLLMLPIGMLYSSIAIFLSLWIFKEHASLIMVFLTVLACIPLAYRTFNLEEKKDTALKKEQEMLKEHKKAFVFLFYLFIGFVIALSIWFIVLPANMVQLLFSSQLNTINAINNPYTGNATSFAVLKDILVNNIKVLFFCTFFAFFYGAGAIFILVWNASVIAAAVGNFVRANLVKYAVSTGFLKTAAYFHVFTMAFVRYMTHGVFEIMAYFVGALAGGLISIAVIRHSPGDKSFTKVMLDALDLLLIAVVTILVGGFVEVYITPLMF